MIANQRMRSCLSKLGLVEAGALTPELVELLNDGFLDEEGCVFLKALRENAGVSASDFPDRTGYECFVNHLHLEDFGCEARTSLAMGRRLIMELQQKLHQQFRFRKFRFMLSCDDGDCSLRFHIVRQGESWLSSNIDEYDEAILMVDS